MVKVDIPVTFNCCASKEVVDVIPRVEVPVTFKVKVVVIPVMSRFLAVISSSTISSFTYKSPPTYKSLTKVPIPVKVEIPATSKEEPL